MAEFVRWALAQLELEVSETDGNLRLQLPETDQASFGKQTELTLTLSGSQDAGHESIEPEGRFGQWLLRRLQALGPAVPIRPLEQPTSVNDITQRLFAAYQVDGGRVHLGGCQLTDYPFLRLSFFAKGAGGTEVRNVFVAHDGSSVSDQLARDLGLLSVEPIIKRPPRIDDPALQALIAAGRRVAVQASTSRDPNATTIEPAVIALIWVKHASGQLQFTIDETTVTLPFSGWARLLEAQPYRSPQSGASSFHLAATDDGRIDVFDQIGTCEQSGRRVLLQELVTCCVTGHQVLEEFTETCPVSGKPCLTEQFATCASCQQRVSKLVLEGDSCLACRQQTKISKDDPRLVWILGEHSGLDRWNHWQLAETKTVYIAQARSWMKRLKLVVDKESLAVHYLATAGRFGNTWSPVAESAHSELLR